MSECSDAPCGAAGSLFFVAVAVTVRASWTERQDCPSHESKRVKTETIQPPARWHISVASRKPTISIADNGTRRIIK